MPSITALTNTLADSTTTSGGYLIGSLVIWVVVGLLFAWVCATIAGRKGYSRALFAILGFFFACITLIIALVLPRRNSV